MKTQTPSRSSNVNLYEASSQWRSRPTDQRFETLDALAAAVNARRKVSRAQDINLRTIDIEADVESDRIQLIDSRAQVLNPSHWSFGQLCQRVGAPAGYLRDLPVELAAQNLQHNVKKLAEDDAKLRFLTVESPSENFVEANRLQAVTSTTYGRIWDADVVAACQKLVDRSGGKFFNPKDWSGRPSGLYASDHDVFMFMIDGGSIVDGGGDRDQLHRGFFMWNSETGARALGMKTFLFRHACGNHIVWGAEEITEYILRHSQGAPDRFNNEVYGKLVEFTNASAKPLEDQVRRAKNFLLPFTDGKKAGEGLIEFGTKHGFTRPEIRGAYACANDEEGQCANLWDFINGLTAHARGYEFVDSRIDLEGRAGKLMNLVSA